LLLSSVASRESSFADGSKWTTHGDGAGLFVPADVGVGVVVGRDAASVADLAVGVVEGVEVVDACSFRFGGRVVIGRDAASVADLAVGVVDVVDACSFLFGVHGLHIRVLKVVPGEDCATESVAGGGGGRSGVCADAGALNDEVAADAAEGAANSCHCTAGSDSYLARPAIPPTVAKFRSARFDLLDPASLWRLDGLSGSTFRARFDFLVPLFTSSISPGILLSRV